VVKRVLSRLRADDGFGIVELTIAMVMLNIGILAIVAAFNSGAVSLSRASKLANATVIADTYLERYRGYRNCQIYLTRSSINGAGGTYGGDVALTQYGLSTASEIDETTAGTSSNAPIPTSCPNAPQTASTVAHTGSYTGPDNRSYIVDVYIVPVQVTGGGWQKRVTVVVRDPAAPSGALDRESSTFDPYDAP
jgi:type II secretory pathway pseudopilin PulG